MNQEIKTGQFTAIIITQNRAEETDTCIRTLLLNDELLNEVLLILNGATEEVKKVSEELASLDYRVRIIETEKTTASLARNIGIDQAQSEFIVFLDDDVIIPSTLLEAYKRSFDEYPKASFIGGPNLTPPDDPPFAQLTGLILGSFVGAGPSSTRYKAYRDGLATVENLVLCNLAARTSVFEEGLRFPPKFGGEENILLREAQQNGAELRYCNDAWVYHRRRPTFTSHIEQIWRYGMGRAFAIYVDDEPQPLFVKASIFFIAYWAFLPLLLWVSLWFGLPLIIYLLSVIIFGLILSLKNKLFKYSLALGGLIVITHFTYSLGLTRYLLFPKPDPES